MTFNLDKFENVNCDSLEAFRKSLTEWNYRQEEAFEYAKAIFQPLSKLNWDPSNIKPVSLHLYAYMTTIPVFDYSFTL